MTESIYINSLTVRTNRSTVRTLPATLPEPWTLVRGPNTEVRGSRTLSRGSWTPNRGYWGLLLDLDRFGSRGGGVCWGCLWLGPWASDGWVGTVAIPLRMLPVLPKLKYLVGRLASLIILRLSMISILALRFPGIWKPDLTSL